MKPDEINNEWRIIAMAKTETVDKRPLVLLITFILGVLILAFVFAFMDKTMAAVKNIGTSTFDAVA